eukprot:jgi/Chrzof1/4554/Cz14g18040.t1
MLPCLRVLSDDPRDKRVAVLGSFEGMSGPAVVLVSRRHFNLQQLPSLLSAQTATTQDFNNDIYYKVGSVVH